MPYALCPMPYALCPMPYALCPLVPHLSEKGYKYLYANASPINFIDPTGRFSITEQTVIMGVITSLAIEAGRAAYAPDPVQTSQTWRKLFRSTRIAKGTLRSINFHRRSCHSWFSWI